MCGRIAPKVGAVLKLGPYMLKAPCFQPLTPEIAYSAFNLNLVCLSLLACCAPLHLGVHAEPRPATDLGWSDAPPAARADALLPRRVRHRRRGQRGGCGGGGGGGAS